MKRLILNKRPKPGETIRVGNILLTVEDCDGYLCFSTDVDDVSETLMDAKSYWKEVTKN